jgi:signal transduction histidine kinase
MSPEIMDQICADLGAGLSTRAQIVQHRKDGTPYDAEVSVTPIRRHRGGLVTFVAIHRDMTARKQLHKYQKDLRSMALELAFAEEQERQRLAENLHDELGPLLFQARLKLELFSRQSPDDTHELADILERMGRIVSRMQFELSPLLLNRLGLRRAIRALAAEMKQKYGLSVEIVEDGEEISVDQRMASVLFRSLRELLINVAKHAETDKARLTVRRLDHIIQIEVEDDGAGFDPRSQSKHVDFGHFGLFSIRERLTYLGGSFDVRSAPGAGATMTLTARV